MTEPGMGDHGEATLDGPQTQDGSVTGSNVLAGTAAVIRTGVVVSAVSAAVVLVVVRAPGCWNDTLRTARSAPGVTACGWR
jgi:hypothetical protein